MGSSVLPHALGAVCDKPAIRHPAGQGEAQVHPDVIIERPVIGRSIRKKTGSICNILYPTLNGPSTASAHFTQPSW